MKKKSFAVAFSILLTVALTICMLPITSSAAEISSQLESALDFYVDFRTESDADIQENYTKTEDASDDVVYEDDTDLGSKVAVFGDAHECYVIAYEPESGEPLSGYDLNNGITLEAYVYINPDTEGNMTFIESAGGSLHLQQYNEGDDHSVGFRCGDIPGPGENGEGGDAGYMMRNAYADHVLDAGKWVHIVGVSDGTTNKFYIDGVEAASVDRVEPTLKGANNNQDLKLTIGESIFGSMFGETAVQGKIAYVKMYKSAATAEDIAALFENAASPVDPAPAVTDEPTAEPTDEPTAAPTAAPTAEPTATPAPAESGMNSTLLIVIIIAAVIVIAAVVVLVIVMMKKSKSNDAGETVKTEETPVKETPAEEPKSEDENKSEE